MFLRWKAKAIAVAAVVGAELLGLASGAAQAQAQDVPDYQPDAVPHGQYQKAATHLSSDGDAVPDHFLAIYSGSTSGTYFKVATTLCDVMRLRYEEHRIRCVPLRSQGVASNVSLMNQGRAQVILVQSDTNWRAAQGEAPIPMGRSVASLHNEAGLLVVRRDADIVRPEDLRGKRVNIATQGSASRTLWDDFLASLGLGEADFDSVYSVTQEYNAEGVCDDHLDAFGLWIGHPTSAIATALSSCDVGLVGMAGPGTRAEDLLTRKPYYFAQTIPAGTYKGQAEDIVTYGLKAVLVADQRAEPYVIYWLTRILVENIDELRARNPVLKELKVEDLFKQGNFLPFHEGAIRLWQEKDWLRPATN